MQSGIEEAVQKLKANTTHEFVTETKDNENFECCKRCGRLKDRLRLPGETYQYFPCKGFVG